jgi:ubiquitin-like modifier-activating enzyme 5
MTKTDAASKTLQEINPDVIYEAHTYNITKLDHYDHFLERYEEILRVSDTSKVAKWRQRR